MFSVFAKANQGLNLTPAQRAFLRLIDGFFVAGITSVIPLVAWLLTQQNVNWAAEVKIIVATFTVAVFMAIAKYYKAQGDAPLADVATQLATEVSTRTGLNDVKQPVLPPLPVSSAAATYPSGVAPVIVQSTDGSIAGETQPVSLVASPASTGA